MQAKLSGPEIARKLNLSRSTIHREINRSKSEPTALARDYQAGAAQLRSQGRRGAGTYSSSSTISDSYMFTR